MRKILLLLTFFTVNFVQAQEVVNIPDYYFNYFLVNSSINTNGDEFIQVSEASVIKGLHIRYAFNIRDLTGIEAFTGLRKLTFRHNTNVDSLDLSSNKELTELYFEFTSLTHINLSNNINLDTLTVKYGHLKSLDISNNHKLKYLDIDGDIISSNRINNLDVSKNTELVVIRCGTQNLTNLDLSNNTRLETLNCSGEPFN